MKAVGSPRVKLLYDIYHMQIMEGDVIRTIRDNIEYIGHFHTGGVPGRHEIDDDSQELHWRTVATGDRGSEVRGLLRARVCAGTRSDGVAQTGIRTVHGVAQASLLLVRRASGLPL